MNQQPLSNNQASNYLNQIKEIRIEEKETRQSSDLFQINSTKLKKIPTATTFSTLCHGRGYRRTMRRPCLTNNGGRITTLRHRHYCHSTGIHCPP
jgi:hypothetical protein